MFLKKEKCAKCNEYKRCRDSGASWIFFIIGIVSTVAIRVVNVLTHLNPIYGKAAWYTGVSGFLVFFLYRFKILVSRAKYISENKLIDKTSDPGQLTDEDYNIIAGILCSLDSKKERMNYFFIFGLSAVALLIAAYFDIVK